MPLYVYRATEGSPACDHCREGFEELESIRAPALTTCPQCHGPVVRLLHPPATKREKTTREILSDDNLKKHGFKKLVNRGHGQGFDEAV